MCHEQFRDLVLLVKHMLHQRLLDPEETAICDRYSGCHAQHLACKASLAEEVARAQCGDNRFFVLFGNNRELHLALSNIEYGLRGLSLIEDASTGSIFNNVYPATDSGE